MTTQVLVSKVSAAQALEAKTPIASEEPSIFRRSMEKSERQLEQLVEELRQMSKTPALALPPIIMASSSSSGSSQDGELGASRQLRLVTTSSAASTSPNVSHHPGGKEGREGGGDSGEQLKRSNLSTEVSLVTQTTPHPQPRGIMPTAQRDDSATHRHRAGHPAKSERGWNKNGGGLVKEYRRENTREYSGLKESSKGCQIELPPGAQLPPVQPNELRSQPESQMQVDSSVIKVDSGLSQVALDSYDQLLATELEIQRLR